MKEAITWILALKWSISSTIPCLAWRAENQKLALSEESPYYVLKWWKLWFQIYNEEFASEYSNFLCLDSDSETDFEAGIKHYRQEALNWWDSIRDNTDEEEKPKVRRNQGKTLSLHPISKEYLYI